ncbi:MAG: class I tRNA ligase family protein [bacterium]|nr:class I tRNA ligase family protein [bacterium]
MKLSKKYKPKSYKKTHFNSVADGTFPIFLPNTTAFDQEALASLQYQELMIRNLYQFTGKQYHPCYFTGLETSSYQDKMQGKKSLPYFAKMQRLEQLSSKQNKKSERWIHQLFSDLEAKRVDFDARLYAQMQSVFDLFKGHQLLTQAPRLVYRDVSTQSVVNEDDIEWRKEEQYVLEIKCFVETKNEVLPLFVTDLLSFFSDVGVVVHTNDKRYKKHIGKNIIIPIINKSIPIFGEEGIDTIKENGILRINPLLSETSLRKTQHYGLNIEEDFIDEQGCFYPGLQHFSGQSIFEFEENIVETLDTIGNLASKEKQLLSVPYSKHTGQRLIKKVLPLWYLDTSSLQA